MLCDEPTSGLDASMASAVASVLAEMASRGRTVICSIHQPSAAVCASFDRLALLAEGRLAFLGTMQEGLDFFARSIRLDSILLTFHLILVLT